MVGQYVDMATKENAAFTHVFVWVVDIISTPCNTMCGGLLMDKRLHRFIHVFLFDRQLTLCPHLATCRHPSRPSPRVQCCCVCKRWFLFCCPCLCLPVLVVSLQHHPILNMEGSGEVRMLLFSLCKCCLRILVVQSFVHQPLRSHILLFMHALSRMKLSRCGDAQGAHPRALFLRFCIT